MKLYKIKTIIAVLLLVLSTACEEVIDIDLNSSNTVLVAEGVIDNGAVAWVKLSYTSDYFDTDATVVEENATVTLSDNEGNSETLEYISDGLYQGKDIIGSIGKQYKVTILKDNVEYEASTQLYAPSKILSVLFEKNDNKKPGETETTYDMTIAFKDDVNTHNYYLVKYQTSADLDKDVSSYYLIDDDNYDNTGEIEYSPFKLSFEEGDSVDLELYSIDEDTYHYYSEMNSASGGMMGGSSTPFTPESNFGTDVLGYFVAWSKVEYSATVL